MSSLKNIARWKEARPQGYRNRKATIAQLKAAAAKQEAVNAEQRKGMEIVTGASQRTGRKDPERERSG